MVPQQVLLLQVKVDLGVKVMSRYSFLQKSLSDNSEHSLGVLLLCKDTISVLFLIQPTELQFKRKNSKFKTKDVGLAAIPIKTSFLRKLQHYHWCYVVVTL